jgi:hypothetical protein
MKLYTTLCILLLLGSSAAGTPPRRRAWEWTTEERIAARTDRDAQQLRVAQSRAASERSTNGSARHVATDAKQDAGAASLHEDSIHGSREPELMMPTEIYTIFMRAAYAHEDDVARSVREDAAEKIAIAGLPADLLQSLEMESFEFISLQREEESLREAMATTPDDPTPIFKKVADIERQECPLRAAAIRRMREQYGKAVFDRFLYEVVAPGAFTEFGTALDAATLLRMEEGCR